MTIRVVRGVVKSVNSSSPAQHKLARARQGAITSTQAANAGRTALHSDASITTLRTTGHLASKERIRDSAEAKSVARDVAGRLKAEDAGIAVHAGLDSAQPQEHFR